MGFDRRLSYDEGAGDSRKGGRGHSERRQRDNRRRGGWEDEPSPISFPVPQFLQSGSRPEQAAAAFSSAPAAEVHTGRVKWFSADKGFGFVSFDAGPGDALLRQDALTNIGRETIAPGATIVCGLKPGSKGMVVSDIASVDDSTAEGPASRKSDAVGGRSEVEGEVSATVKWFSSDKGFGFMTAESGSDIFLHVKALRKYGLEIVHEGDRFLVGWANGQKGRNAVTLSRL